MRMIDLFTGIGGFHLAAEWVWPDLEVVGHCEIDPFCQKVLKKHWPEVPIFDDIFKLKGDQFGTVDLLTGGFPCQPFSVAGKQRGAEDDRALWPEMFRIIKESRPRWVVGENVDQLKNFLEFENMCTDLGRENYEVQPLIIPACGVDAKHRRNRVWIVADTNSGESSKKQRNNKEVCRIQKEKCKPEYSSTVFGGSSREWLPEPNVGRVAHGIPNRVDRLKGLGNAIVPQVVQRIFEAIKHVDKMD